MIMMIMMIMINVIIMQLIINVIVIKVIVIMVIIIQVIVIVFKVIVDIIFISWCHRIHGHYQCHRKHGNHNRYHHEPGLNHLHMVKILIEGNLEGGGGRLQWKQKRPMHLQLGRTSQVTLFGGAFFKCDYWIIGSGPCGILSGKTFNCKSDLRCHMHEVHGECLDFHLPNPPPCPLPGCK